MFNFIWKNNYCLKSFKNDFTVLPGGGVANERGNTGEWSIPNTNEVKYV